MSGTNRQVMSSIVMKGNSQSALIKALENANEVAAKDKPKKQEKK